MWIMEFDAQLCVVVILSKSADRFGHVWDPKEHHFAGILFIAQFWHEHQLAALY